MKLNMSILRNADGTRHQININDDFKSYNNTFTLCGDYVLVFIVCKYSINEKRIRKVFTYRKYK